MLLLGTSILVGMENKRYRAVILAPYKAPGADKPIYQVMIYQKDAYIPENIRSFEKPINGVWWDRRGKNILWIRFCDYSVEKMETQLCKL